MKAILSGTFAKLKDPTFLVASIVVAIIVVPLALKVLRKVPVIGDKLP